MSYPQLASDSLIRLCCWRAQVEYQLRFPKYGFYKFHIFAAPANDLNEGIPGVFNYLIEVLWLF